MLRHPRSLLVLLALASCNSDKIPEPTKQATPPAPAASAVQPAADKAHPPKVPASPPAADTEPLGIEWTVPAGWKEAPGGSAMRKATYEVPAAGGGAGPAELAVFYFGAQMGGDVDANIDRWVGQFKDVAKDGVVRSTGSANGLTQHLVEVRSGTYSGSMMGGGGAPVPDQALLGVVVEAPTGKYFFKLTGPSKTVLAQRAGFDELLKSMKAKSP